VDHSHYEALGAVFGSKIPREKLYDNNGLRATLQESLNHLEFLHGKPVNTERFLGLLNIYSLDITIAAFMIPLLSAEDYAILTLFVSTDHCETLMTKLPEMRKFLRQKLFNSPNKLHEKQLLTECQEKLVQILQETIKATSTPRKTLFDPLVLLELPNELAQTAYALIELASQHGISVEQIQDKTAKDEITEKRNLAELATRGFILEIRTEKKTLYRVILPEDSP
jgi:hypothetical protein